MLTCRGDGGGDGDARLTGADGDGAGDDASDGGDGAPRKPHQSRRPGSIRSHSGANGERLSPCMAGRCS